MYYAAKDELEARLNYDNSKMTSEERVSSLSAVLIRDVSFVAHDQLRSRHVSY